MSFGKMVLSGLINNPQYTQKALPYIKDEWFEDQPEKELFQRIKTYIDKYNNNPTQESLLVAIADSKMEEGLFNKTVETLSTLEYNPLTETQWLVDETEKWGQERAIYLALMKSISIADGEDTELGKHAIPDILMQALGTSFDNHIGHDYFDDAEAQWDYYNCSDERIPFKQKIYNKITRNGVRKKTLSIVLAGINVGKSTSLIDLAGHYLESGLNVLYFTMEMSEQVVRSRIDVRLLQTPSVEIEQMSKDQYLSKVNKLKNKSKGQLVIKEFPIGSAHVGHLRHAISDLKLKKGFKADVIIIDYIGIMASAKLPVNAKGNSNLYLGSIAEEVRALAFSEDVPIWSALQLVRSAQNKDTVSIDDVANSIQTMATCDFAFALAQPEELIPFNKAIGRVLKNRFAERNKILKFMVNLDNNLQCVTDCDDDEQGAVMDTEEMNHLKGVEPKPEMTGWDFTT